MKIRLTSSRQGLEGRIEQGQKEMEELQRILNEIEAQNIKMAEKIE